MQILEIRGYPLAIVSDARQSSSKQMRFGDNQPSGESSLPKSTD